MPSIEELGIRLVENIKTSVVMQGLLAKNKVTVVDTDCGAFQKTGALANFVTNQISVDPLVLATRIAPRPSWAPSFKVCSRLAIPPTRT